MKRTLLLFLFLSFSLFASAQIRYRADGKMLIGNVSAPILGNDLTCSLNGIYMRPEANKYFSIDLHSFSAPSIYCNNPSLLFRNVYDNSFMRIVVGAISITSDITYKRNVTDFVSGLQVTSLLRPVSYNYTYEDTTPASSPYMGTNSHIGFIAQELETILPSLVYTEEDGTKTIDYTSIIPILVRAIQELQAELDQLKNEK